MERFPDDHGPWSPMILKSRFHRIVLNWGRTSILSSMKIWSTLGYVNLSSKKKIVNVWHASAELGTELDFQQYPYQGPFLRILSKYVKTCSSSIGTSDTRRCPKLTLDSIKRKKPETSSWRHINSLHYGRTSPPSASIFSNWSLTGTHKSVKFSKVCINYAQVCSRADN